MEMIKRFFKEEDGATVVEYALMVALIAVAVAATVYLLGVEVNNKFAEVKDCIADPATCE
ncbi:MAG: Flp family type IVb pilin [Gammaproteobacteria bacterium]|nr:Flp family type IVb pilin [Gammaproteobacteria bacterium]